MPDGPRQLHAVRLDARWETTCAVDLSGDVYCWGSDCHGAHVDGLFNLVCSFPKKIPGPKNTKALALGALLEPDCALDGDGAVWCGEAREQGFARVAIPAASAVANAGSFACALLTNGTVTCWGFREPVGRLDAPTLGGNTTPSVVLGLRDVVAISARSGRAAAVTRDGAVFFWDNKQLKAEPLSAEKMAAHALAIGEFHAYFHVSAALSFSSRQEGGHTCAILTDGTLHCWGGDNAHGELGTGTACDKAHCSTAFADVPAVNLPGGVAAASVALGLAHTCALAVDGRAFCWGNNARGELGAETANWFSPTPVEVATQARFVQLVAANNHTCGITNSGWVMCWGENEDGQLGRAMRGKWTSKAERVVF